MDSPRLSTVIGLTIGALLVGALAWWGLTTIRQHENVDATARHGEQITDSIPGVAGAFGQDSIGELREDSCVGSPDPERAARNTRWVAGTGTTVASVQEAQELARAVREEAEARGWTTEVSGGGQGQELLLRASRGELTLVVDAKTTGRDEPEVSLSMTSPCLDKPTGHTMTRSEYDPMYGSSDPMYPDDDRSKFTNGEPRPFRTTSPTGASSTT